MVKRHRSNAIGHASLGAVQGNTNIGQERQEIHQTRSNKNWHWDLTEELA